MQRKFALFLSILLLVMISLPVFAIGEEDTTIPTATIANEQGGPTILRGEVSYTNPFFLSGTAEPLIILEDQTGFVMRDRDYIIPVASQTMGQITSSFYESPFTYSLTLPIRPNAPLNDVDHDGQQDTGVMIFQVAYWSNTFGDPFLERRDLFGGGWSGSYSSVEVSSRSETQGEYIGGNLIIYAPDASQAFPSGFGADGLLFTADDPLVIVPQGYTIVNLDSDPFTFDRSSEPTLNLIEGEGAEADDFSELTFTAAFDAMVDKFRREYAFTEYYNLNWDQLQAEYRPRIEAAQNNNDADAFTIALQDFLWNVPDGHVALSFNQTIADRFIFETDGGLGIAIRELDDGRVIVNYVTPESPAALEGIQLGTEIISLAGMPIQDAVQNARPFLNHPNNHVLKLQQLRYVTRFPLGTQVEITYRNPNSMSQRTATLTTIAERDSFAFSSFNVTRTGYEIPVVFEPVGDYLLVSINSFSDDERLTTILWERVLQQAIAGGVPGIIIDMRNNGGGSGFLADQMAAYFFQEEHVLGSNGRYDEDVQGFYFDEDYTETFMLPPEEMRYDGAVAVLVGPNCFSACEFFTYNMTINNRAAIVGQYPTGGLGGGVEDFFMPNGITIRMTVARAVDANGEIHIEGVGVVPTVDVPVTEETLFADGDPILEAAIEHLNSTIGE
jgi:C-terminal processing protease CtpA/Prc